MLGAWSMIQHRRRTCLLASRPWTSPTPTRPRSPPPHRPTPPRRPERPLRSSSTHPATPRWSRSSGLGDARGATQALILGFVATVATFAMAFLLPDAIGRAVPLAGVFAVRAYAALDRAKLDAHRRAGGKQESGWKVTGISLVALVLMLFLFGGGVLFIEAVTGKEW